MEFMMRNLTIATPHFKINYLPIFKEMPPMTSQISNERFSYIIRQTYAKLQKQPRLICFGGPICFFLMPNGKTKVVNPADWLNGKISIHD